MEDKGPNDRDADTPREKTDGTQGFDPRDTKHPAGEEQTAHNAAENPSG